MAAVTEDFMKNLLAAQEAQRKKENQDFKEEMKVVMSEGIKSEVDKATKPLKDCQEKIIQDQASLLKTVEELAKKVVEIEKENEKVSEYPRFKTPQESESRRNTIIVERRAETEDLSKHQTAVRGCPT